MICLKPESTCCICLESTYLRFDCRRCKMCKQYTHHSCFRLWSQHTITRKCPTCRTSEVTKRSAFRKWMEKQREIRQRRITIHEFLKESNHSSHSNSRWKYVLRKIKYKVRMTHKKTQNDSIEDDSENSE